MKNVSQLKLKIGYKVVREKDGKIISAIISDDKFTVEYIVGQQTKPLARGTRLMAFETLAEAEYFYKCEKDARHSHGGNFHIYEAILINPKKLPYVFQVQGYGFKHYQEIIKNWHKLFNDAPNTNHYSSKSAPSASLACERIQLTKLIK